MEVKFGKLRSSNNFFAAPVSKTGEDELWNFEDNKQNQNQEKQEQNEKKSGIRLNDYDSNLLSNSAYQTMPDEAFKMELRINALEEIINKINNEIETLENLGYDIQLNALKERKSKLENELAELSERYEKLGFGSKISGQIASAVNSASSQKSSILGKLNALLNFLFSRMSKKFDCTQKMNLALTSLDKINLNIDELVKMQAPYGETFNRYEKLTIYLNQANLLHSQISKNLNSLSKKKA